MIGCHLKYVAHLALSLAGDPNYVLIEPRVEKKIDPNKNVEERRPNVKLLSIHCSSLASFYQVVRLVAIIYLKNKLLS